MSRQLQNLRIAVLPFFLLKIMSRTYTHRLQYTAHQTGLSIITNTIGITDDCCWAASNRMCQKLNCLSWIICLIDFSMFEAKMKWNEQRRHLMHCIALMNHISQYFCAHVTYFLFNFFYFLHLVQLKEVRERKKSTLYLNESDEVENIKNRLSSSRSQWNWLSSVKSYCLYLPCVHCTGY